MSDPPGQIVLDQNDAWVLAQLFWEHLPSLRLLTAWLYVSALHIQDGNTPLPLEIAGLGRLIDDLSGAGPPIYDSEDLRGALRTYVSGTRF